MAESLNPSIGHRFRAALRPDWTRTVLARRITAGFLVVLAGVAAVRADPQGERTDVVVAARDLSPGIALTADDLRLHTVLTTTVPDGAQRDPQALVGATLAGPARRGEVLTDVRVLGPRLAEAARGKNTRVVAVPLADPALIDVIRSGDVVDVLCAPAGDPDAAPRLVATDAVVVLVSDPAAGADPDRVVLVALPMTAATEVAGAALTQAVTLTLH